MTEYKHPWQSSVIHSSNMTKPSQPSVSDYVPYPDCIALAQYGTFLNPIQQSLSTQHNKTACEARYDTCSRLKARVPAPSSSSDWSVRFRIALPESLNFHFPKIVVLST